MIKKIDIKKFGLFSDFEWKNKIRDKGNNVVDFQKENIIYGRNYSGKTTLSRIIRSLETKNISEKYENPTFAIELYDNSKIHQNNYVSNSLKVRVFNEDFVKENLSFIIDPNGKINPFAILGENTNIQPQIDNLANELGSNEKDNETGLYEKLKDLQESKNIKYKDWNNLESHLNTILTNKGKDIRKANNKYGNLYYDIRNIKVDISDIKDVNYIAITPEKEKQNEQIIKEEIKQEIKYSLFEQFKHIEFSERAKELLSKNILDANKIEELINNAFLNNWVKTGYDLHKDNRENCKCGFCGNIVSQTRWAELDKHFDEETEKLKRDLISFQNLISDEIAKIPNLLNKTLFYTEFQNDAENILNGLQEEYNRYKSDLENIKNKIKEREENILQVLNFEFELTFSADNFEVLKQSFSDLVEKNNENAQNLSSNQEIAKKELRLLEVKRFLEGIKYDELQQSILDKKKIYEDEVEKVKKLSDEIDEKEKQLTLLEAELKDEKKGAEKVNFYLNNFFGHQNLTLEAIENDDTDKKIKFEIKRDRITAYHLSEGECSLVAFCYFMAKLDDTETSGHKPIIFIDDPISSLDSNHIFYVYSLINSELFCKNKFEQIFISTHNLEFLKYLKRLQKSENSKREHFIIHRNKENTEILLMPNYMKDYITEFNYLFHQIYRCANEDIEDNNYHIFYNFGNNARKFLEILLSYKYPNAKINDKLQKYFNHHQATLQTDRVNNEYSHLEGTFEKGNIIPENNFIEMQKVAQFILRKMQEKDDEQYNALLESIGENLTN